MASRAFAALLLCAAAAFVSHCALTAFVAPPTEVSLRRSPTVAMQFFQQDQKEAPTPAPTPPPGQGTSDLVTFVIGAAVLAIPFLLQSPPSDETEAFVLKNAMVGTPE
mmetsp:Transcript_28088/g.52678  ORF Transcript_28088/g.52678 Transcript_28088/m.52678 type:complete len:108 (-) Transcript_28088:97-420(-)